MRTVLGTCHHDCPDSCGWVATVDGDGDAARAVQLRGNPAHPYSRGELCPKVNRYLDRVYHDDRVLQPLRRVGAKGEGRFEPISWDDALTEIATRLDGLPGESILPYVSAGNQGLLALGFGQRLWNHLGATEVTGALCGAVAGAGTATTLGTKKALDPSEMVHSRLIILWGTNTRLTNRHLWPFIEEARAAGAQTVVIDPMRTITADSADWFLQPLPGTDIALMLAMMHVLVRDDLLDHEWLATNTTGFDQLAAEVAGWTPARAAAETGLAADDIERLAHLYGTVRPAAIRTLIGAEHREQGAMFFRTLSCLPALVGAWRDRGGGYARSIGVYSDDLIDGQALSRPDLLAGRTPRRLAMPHLGRALVADDSIAALFLVAVNALVSVPGTETVRRGLLRDDLFTVVHEQFLTDTTRYADLVLPATTHLEAVDVVPSWGHLYLGWNEPAIAPRGEAVSNSELHRRLARALGCTEPALFDDDLTVLADTLPTVDLDELRATGFVRVPYPDDGRALPHTNFVVEGRLPAYTPPPRTGHPLALLTPKRHTRFLNSSYTHLHGHLEGGPCIEMSADDAARLGLADGSTARVWNERAELRLPVSVSPRVRSGLVAVPWGWWDTGVGGVANSLTNDNLTDWGEGVAFHDSWVSVAPA